MIQIDLSTIFYFYIVIKFKVTYFRIIFHCQNKNVCRKYDVKMEILKDSHFPFFCKISRCYCCSRLLRLVVKLPCTLFAQFFRALYERAQVYTHDRANIADFFSARRSDCHYLRDFSIPVRREFTCATTLAIE